MATVLQPIGRMEARKTVPHDPLQTIPKRAVETLEYFLRHPQAVDSLEGVARWRLVFEHVERGLEEINQALQWLVAQGLLVETAMPGKPPTFSLEPSGMTAAQRFVAGRYDSDVDGNE